MKLDKARRPLYGSVENVVFVAFCDIGSQQENGTETTIESCLELEARQAERLLLGQEPNSARPSLTRRTVLGM